MTIEALNDNQYLARYLAPFHQWLAQNNVTEVIVNRPGEVWLEAQGEPEMIRVETPDVTTGLLSSLATQIARYSHQAISRENPLLAATLPSGDRIQIVAPGATRGEWAMAIRRHKLVDLSLDMYRGDKSRNNAQPITSNKIQEPPTAPVDRIIEAVRARKTILISGGTSSGKTTFLNALLKEVPPHERIVAIEDTAEIQLCHKNALGLVAVHGETGEAQVKTDDLLKASLRLRPDRIVVGEIRGTEAVTFLRAINTGHPGSFTTVHANTPAGALEQVAMMIMQARLGLNREETLAYIRSLVDVVVQLGRSGGERYIADILELEPTV